MIIPNTQILAREIAMSEYSLAIQVFEYGARLYTVTLQVKGWWWPIVFKSWGLLAVTPEYYKYRVSICSSVFINLISQWKLNIVHVISIMSMSQHSGNQLCIHSVWKTQLITWKIHAYILFSIIHIPLIPIMYIFCAGSILEYSNMRFHPSLWSGCTDVYSQHLHIPSTNQSTSK